MKLTKTLKVTLLTTVCFGMSYTLSMVGGLNRDTVYPLSLLKAYAKNGGEETSVHIQKTIPFLNFKSLSVKTTATDIEVKASQDGQFHVELEGNFPVTKEDQALVVESDENRLKIRTEEDDSEHSFRLKFDSKKVTQKITLVFPQPMIDQLDVMILETVSGDMKLDQEFKGTLDLETVSGDLKISGKVHEIKTQTISGNLELNLKNEGQRIYFDSVSGNIRVNLPANAHSETQVSTVSGTVGIDPSIQSGHAKGGIISAKTVSGNVQIKSL